MSRRSAALEVDPLASPHFSPGALPDNAIPNFLVIGAQRCGTTWLWRWLRAHPEVFVPDRKELEFFSYRSNLTAEGWRGYLNHFRDSGPYKWRGECTPSYFMTVDPESSWQSPIQDFNTTIPADVKRFLGPDLRLILILRHPVDRAVSAYFHHARRNRIDPTQSILAAGRRQNVIEAGFYGRHLSEWLEHFDRSNFCILTTGAVECDPAGALRQVADFLSIGQRFDAGAHAPVNAGFRLGWFGGDLRPMRRPLAGHRVRRDDLFRLESIYERDQARLAAILGSKLVPRSPLLEGARGPAWIRVARTLLPDRLRRGLNAINRKRIAMMSGGQPKSSRGSAPQLVDPSGPFYCPLCRNRIRTFLPGGPHARAGARCPSCGSLERHRAFWAYLEETARWLAGEQPIRLLHLAPDHPLERRLRECSHIHYLSADLEPGRAMEVIDLTSVEKPDESFDVIICSHVLEHIPDDRRAMRELERIMKPEGRVYIQVPLQREPTFEDWSIDTPEGRKEAFGQADHVRIYGPDIVERLESAGLAAEIILVERRIEAQQARAMGIRGRTVIECSRSA